MLQPIQAITDPEKLRARTEILLRLAGSVARFGGWSFEFESGTYFWSREVCLILGFADGKPPTSEVANTLFPDEDRELVVAAMEACSRDGTPFDQLRYIHNANGDLLHVRMVGEALRDASGRITHVDGAMHDFTAQELDRRARIAVEEQLATTLDSLTDGMLIFDSEWRYTYINPRAIELLLLNGPAMLGKVFWDVVPAEVASTFGATMTRAATERVTVTATEFHPIIRRWLEVTAYPSNSGIAMYVRDVSEEQAIERALAAKAEVIASQAALLDVARDAIIVRTVDHRVQYWNRAAEELYGWTPAEAIGTSVRELLYSDPAEFDLAVAAVLRDGQWAGDIVQRTRTGATVIAECSWTLVRDTDGAPKSILAVNTDVTNRRRDEDLTLRRERMESLGTLAGGVAHDLNNVLAPLLLAVQLLSSTETDPRRTALLSTMEGSVKRGADMIRQILSFARGAEGKRILVDVRRLLRELETFAREALPASIDLIVIADDDLWHPLGDPIQLLQVLVNLVMNARDAMPEGGRISVTAKNTELDAAYASVSHVAAPGRYIVIDVEDNGSGMSPEVIDRAFEPFFTTKPVGSGTGLGLASSLAIIRAHGGHVQAYSEPGRGSRFELHLAAAGEHVASAILETKDIAELPVGRGQTVLVVDDEEAVRQLSRETLEVFGYRTLGAGNGEEALAIVRDQTERVDLVLTDMMMPVMDGASLALELEKSHPQIGVVLTSGLNANGGTDSARRASQREFIAKPFTAQTLVSAVAATLAREGIGHGRD